MIFARRTRYTSGHSPISPPRLRLYFMINDRGVLLRGKAALGGTLPFITAGFVARYLYREAPVIALGQMRPRRHEVASRSRTVTGLLSSDHARPCHHHHPFLFPLAQINRADGQGFLNLKSLLFFYFKFKSGSGHKPAATRTGERQAALHPEPHSAQWHVGTKS